MEARLEDEKPLADVLQELIESSPNLVTLLQLGHRISTPFDTRPTKEDRDVEFRGVLYPTYFKFKGVEYGTPVSLARPINRRIRLTFETDARNDYFTRSAERGGFDWIWTDMGNDTSASFTGPNLRNGIATVMITLPNEAVVGEELSFLARAHDSMRTFEIPFRITPLAEIDRKGGGSGGRKNPPGKRKGNNRETPLKIEPPRIIRVTRDKWSENDFDEFTAMKVVSLGASPSDEKSEIYEFKVNMDNTPLLNESKLKRLDDDKHKPALRTVSVCQRAHRSFLVAGRSKESQQPVSRQRSPYRVYRRSYRLGLPSNGPVCPYDVVLRYCGFGI